MIDPNSYVYAEMMAPDWRIAILIAVLVIGAVAGRIRGHISAAQARLLVGYFVMLYAWTFVVGNGRYFIAWLLIAGPLLVLVTRWLPGSAGLRWMVLGIAVAVQAVVLGMSYRIDNWGLASWDRGPGIALESSPLQLQPAVFLTISTNSYSILIPRFHLQSRWANIAGQVDLKPGVAEYERLMAMLMTEMPKYVVLPIIAAYENLDRQPNDQVRGLIAQALAPVRLQEAGTVCQVLQSTLAPGPKGTGDAPAPLRGFWFCPLERALHPINRPIELGIDRGAEWAEIFRRIEQRCPRFFPPGGGNERHAEGVTLRRYSSSDTTLYIHDSGQVVYRYFRAINPTVIGTVDQVRQGEFTIACDKLPGRFTLPWQRD